RRWLRLKWHQRHRALAPPSRERSQQPPPLAPECLALGAATLELSLEHRDLGPRGQLIVAVRHTSIVMPLARAVKPKPANIAPPSAKNNCSTGAFFGNFTAAIRQGNDRNAINNRPGGPLEEG